MKKHSLISILSSLFWFVVFAAAAIWAFKGADPESIKWLTVPLMKVFKFIFMVVFLIPFAMAVGSSVFTKHKF